MSNTHLLLPPSLKQRLLGIFVDYLIILAYIVILLCVTFTAHYFFTEHLPNTSLVNPWLGEMIGFVTLTLPVALYFILTESGSRQASIGKRVARIVVSNKDGAKASLRQIVIRTVIKFLPWELAHVSIYHLVAANQSGQMLSIAINIGLFVSNLLFLVYVLTIIFRHDHGGPYDMVAGTTLRSR